MTRRDLDAIVRPELLREALMHRSALLTRPGRVSNERLELLGDRVLGLIMTEWLMGKFPSESEGDLSRRISNLVSEPVLARVANRIGLGKELIADPTASKAGVRKRDSVLADALEALIGAIYLSGRLAVVRNFVRECWASEVEDQPLPPKDAKTALQEWAQGNGYGTPVYAITAQHGPQHALTFVMTVEITATVGAPNRMSASAEGNSKRSAETAAAALLLAQIQDLT